MQVDASSPSLYDSQLIPNESIRYDFKTNKDYSSSTSPIHKINLEITKSKEHQPFGKKNFNLKHPYTDAREKKNWGKLGT